MCGLYVLSIMVIGLKVWKQRTWVHWKPLLWFCKGNKPDMLNDIHDYIESKPVDKELHEWQQSTIEAEYMIKHLTVENETILRPIHGQLARLE